MVPVPLAGEAVRELGEVVVGVGSRSTIPVVMDDLRCCPAATMGSRGGEGGAEEQGVVLENPPWRGEVWSRMRWYIA